MAEEYERICHPVFCNYARHTEEDLSAGRSCRTFDVMYCILLEKIVAKSGKCIAKEEDF